MNEEVSPDAIKEEDVTEESIIKTPEKKAEAPAAL